MKPHRPMTLIRRHVIWTKNRNYPRQKNLLSHNSMAKIKNRVHMTFAKMCLEISALHKLWSCDHAQYWPIKISDHSRLSLYQTLVQKSPNRISLIKQTRPEFLWTNFWFKRARFRFFWTEVSSKRPSSGSFDPDLVLLNQKLVQRDPIRALWNRSWFRETRFGFFWTRSWFKGTRIWLFWTRRFKSDSIEP